MNRSETNPEGMLDRIIGEIRDEPIDNSRWSPGAVCGTASRSSAPRQGVLRAAPISRR